MGKRRPARKRAVLGYPSHWFKPEELLSFIELRPFARRWEQLGLSDLELEALQVAIMLRPKSGDVIEGTGGLRKMRFALSGAGKGKSGGLRVCYAYIEEVATVILATVYQKGEKDDLDKDEKAAVAVAIARVRRLLLNRPYRRGQRSEPEE
jgi:hypothetical protein